MLLQDAYRTDGRHDTLALRQTMSYLMALDAAGNRMTTSDEELLQRMSAGDPDAFAEFYDRHAGRVLGLLINLLGRRADAEDVHQEAFWYVWKNAARFDRSRSTPLLWVMMIARSRAADRRRRLRRDQTAQVPAAEGAVLPQEPVVERLDACHELHAALAKLPDEQRGAISLAFYGGLTHQQIAQVQSIALGTVKTRIRLGLARLRDVLRSPGRACA